MRNVIKILFIALLTVSCSGPMNLNEVAKTKVVPHVEQMFIHDAATNNLLGTGTGFHLKVDDEVFIVTNKHICQEYQMLTSSSDEATLTFIKKTTYKVRDLRGQELRILKISEEHDLCLLSSTRDEGLELASRDVQNYEDITVVGYPRGLAKTVRHGNKISTEHEVFPWVSPNAITFNFMNVVAYGGNSGSPVTNSNGEVVGVLFGGFRDYHTESMIVPLLDLKIFIQMYLLGR